MIQNEPRSVKKQIPISIPRSTSSEFQGGRIPMKSFFFGIVTLLCFVLLASLQSAEPWKPLFNGKDFTGWTVPARGDGPSLSPAEAGWKIEDGIIVGGQAGPSQKGGGLVSLARFKDFELGGRLHACRAACRPGR